MISNDTHRFLYVNSRILTPLHRAATIEGLQVVLAKKKEICDGASAFSGHIISKIDAEYYLKYVQIQLFMSEGERPDRDDLDARIRYINTYLASIYEAPLSSGVQRIVLVPAALDEVIAQCSFL